jgi:hypothetical protein
MKFNGFVGEIAEWVSSLDTGSQISFLNFILFAILILGGFIIDRAPGKIPELWVGLFFFFVGLQGLPRVIRKETRKLIPPFKMVQGTWAVVEGIFYMVVGWGLFLFCLVLAVV